MKSIVEYVSKFRTITHVIAIGIGLFVAWLTAHPQIVSDVATAYPHLPIALGVSFLLALYHKSSA